MGLFGGRSRAEKGHISRLKRQGFTEFAVKEATGVPDARQLVGGTLMARLAPDELPDVVYLLASPDGGEPARLTARDVVGLHARSRGMSWFGFGASGALAASLASSLDRHLAGWELSILHADGLAVRMQTLIGAPPQTLLRSAAHRASLAPAEVPTSPSPRTAPTAAQPTSTSASRKSPLPKGKEDVAKWLAGHARALPPPEEVNGDLHMLQLVCLDHDLDSCGMPINQHYEGAFVAECSRPEIARFNISPDGAEFSFEPSLFLLDRDSRATRERQQAFDQALQKVDWPGRAASESVLSYDSPRVSQDELPEVAKQAVEVMAHLRIKPSRLWLLKIVSPNDAAAADQVSVVDQPPASSDSPSALPHDFPGPHDRDDLAALIAAHAAALPGRPNSYLKVVWAHHPPDRCGVPLPKHAETGAACTKPMPNFMITSDTGKVKISPSIYVPANNKLRDGGYQANRDLDKTLIEHGWSNRSVADDGSVSWQGTEMRDGEYEPMAAKAIDALLAAGARPGRIWLVDVTGPSFVEGRASALVSLPSETVTAPPGRAGGATQWTCANCNRLHNPNQEKCLRCGTPRGEPPTGKKHLA